MTWRHRFLAGYYGGLGGGCVIAVAYHWHSGGWAGAGWVLLCGAVGGVAGLLSGLVTKR